MAHTEESLYANQIATRHPLLFPTLMMVVGAACGMRLWYSPWLALSLAGICGVAWYGLCHMAAKRNRWTWWASVMIALAIGLVSFFNARMTVLRMDAANEVFRSLEESRANVIMRGRVLSEPSMRQMSSGSVRMRFMFEVDHIPTEYGPIDVDGARIQVNWYGSSKLVSQHPPYPLPRVGEGWQLHGRLREIEIGASVPLTTFRVNRRDGVNWYYPDLDAPNLMLVLNRLRSRAAETLSEGVSEESSALGIIRAMTLGFRSDIPREVMDDFKASGTVHIFAISGLHVGIVSSVIMVLLSFLSVHGQTRVIVFAVLIIAYTIATGAKPSAVRACLMALVFFGGTLVMRRPDPLSSLCAAALLILAFEPQQVINLGFIFSFLCAGGLILFVAPLYRGYLRVEDQMGEWFRRQQSNLSYGLEDGPKMSNRRRFAQSMLHMLVTSLIVSLVAWVVSTPFMAMYFGRITPISIACNLVVIPMAFLVVVTAAFSLMSGLFSPWCASVFNCANLQFADWLADVARFFGELPGGNFTCDPWSWGWVVAWYAVLLVCYLFRAVR